jgi:hypothetical protein
MTMSRLVVATTLHTQLSLFQLCISSNTPSYLEEGHGWNTLANLIRQALSILQFWFEKHLDELTQFKARL